MALTLKDVYNSLENPLNRSGMISELVQDYTQSERMVMGANGGMYDALVKNSTITDTSITNEASKEKFWVNFYNQWIKNITSLTPQQISDIQTKNNLDIIPLKNYLSQVGKVHSMQDIKNLVNNPLIKNKDVYKLQLNDGWEHIKSKYSSGRTESSIDVKHRLYINAQMKDIYEIADLFRQRCEDKGIPYYFKFNPGQQSSGRNDTIVIYSNDEQFATYVEILQSIKRDFPNLANGCGKPPRMTGLYDGWIGIADEPEKIFKSNYSYNQIRALVLEEGIESAVINSIYKLSGSKVNFNGNSIVFNSYLKNKMASIIAEQTIKNYKNLDDKTKQKLINEIQTGLTSKVINDGFKTLLSIKDRQEKLGSNADSFADIQTSYGKASLNINIMDKIVRSMVDLVRSVDKDFESDVRKCITQKAIDRKIDADTFAMNESTKIKAQGLSQTNQTSTSQTQTPKFTTVSRGFKPTPTPEPEPVQYGKVNKPIQLDILSSFTVKTEAEILAELDKRNSEIEQGNAYARMVKGTGQKLLTKADICPYYVVDKNGVTRDVWSINNTNFVNLFDQVMNYGDKTEKMNFLKMVSVMEGKINLTMSESAKILDIQNNLTKQDGLDKDIIGALNHLIKDNIKNATYVAKYMKARNRDMSPISREDIAKYLKQMGENETRRQKANENNATQTNKTQVVQPKNVKSNTQTTIKQPSKPATQPSPIILQTKTEQEIQAELDKRNSVIKQGNVYARMVKGVGQTLLTKADICPMTIKTSSGDRDVWEMPIDVLLSKCEQVFGYGDNQQINNIINLIGCIKGGNKKPTYGDTAKILQLKQAYTHQGNGGIADSLGMLSGMSKDILEEANVVTRYLKDMSGAYSPVTDADMIRVLDNLQKMENEKHLSNSNGISIN